MKFILVLTFLISTFTSFSQINLIKKVSEKAESLINKDVKLTESDIVKGLTEALKRGCSFSVNVSSAEGGFNNNKLIRIPFPDESIKNNLLNIGFSENVKQFEESMNRSAEIASQNALSVLEQAVSKMSINDALNILNGEDNAATIYLKNSTYQYLYYKFYPIVSLAMEKSEISKKWNLDKKFSPKMRNPVRKKLLKGWSSAIKKTLSN